MNFFNKIPTITYNDNLVRNIMARAKLSDATKSNSRLFFPYTVTESDRIDHLSNSYYGSPNYTWLIWFSNDTIDPYYDMPLSEQELMDFIASKYGSIEIAQRKIAYFKTNWEDETIKISKDSYNNMIGSTKRYWKPLLDYNLNVQGYIRKQEDEFLNTNRMATMNINNISGTFKIGEEIQVDGTNYGFNVSSDASTVVLQHLYGYFYTGDTIVGKESGATATISTVENVISTTLAYEHSNYWKAVSYYDHELNENEKKKNIQLLDAQQMFTAEQELKRVMEEE